MTRAVPSAHIHRVRQPRITVAGIVTALFEKRRTTAAFDALDDRDLRDIGLERTEFGYRARPGATAFGRESRWW
jgi:uncharacterized protein YjiS (DUF1127 family)